MKFHKEHYLKNEEFVGYCKGLLLLNFDNFTLCIVQMRFFDWVLSSLSVNKDAQAAKELLLLAQTATDQKKWIQRMSKRVKARLAG